MDPVCLVFEVLFRPRLKVLRAFCVVSKVNSGIPFALVHIGVKRVLEAYVHQALRVVNPIGLNGLESLRLVKELVACILADLLGTLADVILHEVVSDLLLVLLDCRLAYLWVQILVPTYPSECELHLLVCEEILH